MTINDFLEKLQGHNEVEFKDLKEGDYFRYYIVKPDGTEKVPFAKLLSYDKCKNRAHLQAFKSPLRWYIYLKDPSLRFFVKQKSS